MLSAEILKADTLLDDINALLQEDKALEAADPVAYQAKQFNPTAELDPAYDPLAKFEAQIRAFKDNNKDWNLKEYEEAHPAPKLETTADLMSAAADVEAAGGRIDAFNPWSQTMVHWEALDPTAVDLTLPAPVTTKPNWFQRNVLRQKPTTTGLAAEYKMVGAEDIETLFTDWEDDDLDALDTRINLVEDQVELNVDLFKDTTGIARQAIATGDMTLADVAKYIEVQMEEPLQDAPFKFKDTRPDFEEIKEGDLPGLDRAIDAYMDRPVDAINHPLANDPDAPKIYVESQAMVHNLTDTNTGRIYEEVPEFDFNATNIHTYPIVPDEVAAGGEVAMAEWRASLVEEPVLDAPVQYDPWGQTDPLDADDFNAIGNEDVWFYGPQETEMVEYNTTAADFETEMARSHPSYFLQQAYGEVPVVPNPLNLDGMNALTDLKVLAPPAIGNYTESAEEGMIMAGRAAAEAGEGFWSKLWGGITKVWGYVEDVASGFVMIYPNMLYETDWKQVEYEEAADKFREVQRMETVKWDNKDIWYLLFGYWYKGRCKITSPGGFYDVYHPYTGVDVTFTYMDILNFGRPIDGHHGVGNVYDGTNRVQLATMFQPMKNFIGYWLPKTGPLVPFQCKLHD